MAISQPTDSFLPEELETQQFTLQNDHSLFTILRKNIYSNVILAPIREISTNAVDSCIEAELPVKWDVHIPTLEEPFFSVRDYGIGMTQDFLEGDFTVVGSSTKRSSNKTNGQFGMGRLSPLAYTTSFTVESWCNNTHYSYLVSIANGIPSLLKLGEEPSSEPTGAKFTFTVNPSDIYTFHNTAANLYKYFDYKPTSINTELPEVNISLKSDNFMLTDDSVGIVMANVYYPISSSHIKINYNGLVLKVPTGKVSLTPGRESLNYDTDTVKYLQEYVEEIEEEIVEISNTEITSQPTLYLQGKKYWEIIEKTPWNRRNYITHPTGNNFNITKSIPISSPSFDVSVKTPYYKTLRNPAHMYNVRDSWFYKADYLIVDQRSFTHCLEDLGSNVCLFKPKTSNDIQTTIDILEAFGITNYRLASSFESADKVDKPQKPRVNNLILRNVSNSCMYTYTEDMGVVYYVPYAKISPELDIKESVLSSIVKNLGYTFTLYGIAKSSLSKIKNNNNFINFYDKLKEDFKDKSILVYSTDESIFAPFRYYNDNFFTRVKTATVVPTELQKTINYVNSLEHLVRKFPEFKDLSSLSEYITIHDYKITPSYSPKTITEKYPLLRCIQSQEEKDIHHYLALEYHYENTLCNTN